jgi:hypothetical protein
MNCVDVDYSTAHVLSYLVTRLNDLCSHFHYCLRVFSQFNNDGSVLERKRRRASSVRSPENTVNLRVALQRGPSKSTRKVAAQLGDIQTIGTTNIEK